MRVLAVIALIGMGAGLTACGGSDDKTSSTAATNPTTSTASDAVTTADVTKIPIGDDKTVTDGAKKGYTYRCGGAGGGNQGGAENDGPWLHGKTWNLNEKIDVPGSVSWSQAKVSFKDSGSDFDIAGNGLPVDTKTGTFPIPSNSEAYQYDRNPNSIEEQSVEIAVPLSPEKAGEPSCLSPGAIGIATNGVVIFDGLDALERDAVAHEVQDSCSGHPQRSGVYHYHGIYACLTSTNCKASQEDPELIGYALDGFGIYAPCERGEIVNNDDLDVCHGKTSEVEFHGAMSKMYHYVATFEYPYTLGCFRGTVDEGAQRALSGGEGGGGPGGPPA